MGPGRFRSISFSNLTRPGLGFLRTPNNYTIEILPSISPATSLLSLISAAVKPVFLFDHLQITSSLRSELPMMIIVAAMVLGVLLGALFLIPRERNAQKAQSNAINKPSKIHSKAEVSVHNKRSDCWIIIKNKVYDVTSYVEEHPGGDAILAHAGDDSTEGFYGPQHATRVFDMIDDFYVGDLKQ